MKKKILISAILIAIALPVLHSQEALPIGWHSTDIGSQSLPGSTSWDADAEVFTLEGTGDQIFRPDNVHFAYTVQSGNFEIITLVSYVYGMGQMGYGLNPMEEAGVMIREDLSPFSNTYYLSIQGGEKGGIRYYLRNNDDLDKMNHPGEGAKGMTVPCWLKLKRIGNRFDSYFSQDGINWIYSPDASETIELNPTCYAGLFCRGNANYVELFGWENPNNESILPMVSEFEATQIKQIANIYTVQNPVQAQFVNIEKDTGYIDVSSVFGRLQDDEISYSINSSNIKICRAVVPAESDSIMVWPKSTGSCTMTLEGDVSSFNLVNKFPVFVWEAPEGWSSMDLGEMRTPGFVMKEGNLLTMGGSADVSSQIPGEGLHFMHKSLDGDAELIAKIGSVNFATPGATGGITFNTDAVSLNGVMARLIYTGTGDARFESRSMDGDTLVVNAETAISIPSWIRMKKEGDQFRAYLSDDGLVWNMLGTALDVDLGSEYKAGLIAGSSDNDNLSMLFFEDVVLNHSSLQVNNPIPGQRITVGTQLNLNVSDVFGHPAGVLPSLTIENSAEEIISVSLMGDSSLTIVADAPGEATITLSTGENPEDPESQFVVTVTAALEEDWIFADIGGPLWEGQAANEGENAYSISTFGTGIEGIFDNFSFLYQQRSGAQQIITRIPAIEERGSKSQAGVMFRETTDPGSLYILYTCTAYEGIIFQYRWDDHSGPITEVSDMSAEAPCWLKLTRDEFNYFSASYSLDGISWIPHGEFSVPLELPETALVGLTATSGFNEGTSWFEEVDISAYTGIGEHEDLLPVRITQLPNPFTESAMIRIDVNEATRMQIDLYNMAGIRVTQLLNDQVWPGGHQIILNGAELSSGAYFYRVVTPDYVITNKIIKTR